MWVTQTYLGEVEPNAQLYVYYLFEDYDLEQKAFTGRVQRELEELGETYGDAVSLLFPNERYTTRIGAQMRSIQDFWWTLNGKLPGLLISSKPLSKFDPKGHRCILQLGWWGIAHRRRRRWEHCRHRT